MGELTFLKLREARKAASDLVDRFGLTSPADIRLEDICWALGLRIEYGGLTGAAARLIRHGNTAIIRVSDADGYKARQRFSVAHEVGHFQLDHQNSHWRACFKGDIEAPAKGLQESEANSFASELLMPAKMLRKACEVSPVNLKPAREIAERFDVSLTAAALRFVQLSSEMCAVVASAQGKVLWVVKSDSLKSYLPGKGSLLSEGTLAFDYFSNGTEWKDPDAVAIDTWFENESDGEVMEHTVVIPQVDQTLTMLWIEG